MELPQTIFMDRNEPDKLPTIQISFIQHLVSPLFTACAEAGIIPADVEEDEKEGGDKEQTNGSLTKTLSEDDDTMSMGDDDVMEDELTEASVQPVRKVISIILTNLQMNFDSWHAEETAILERQKLTLKRETGSIEEEDEEEKVEISDQLVAVREEGPQS